MTSSGPVKILTVGPAAGAIRALFSKVAAIDTKHGKFDLVLCVGDFFGPPDASEHSNEEVSDLLAGEIEVPVDCYIMQGEYPLPHAVIEKFAKTGGELCKNVFLMAKSGFMKTANGLRVGCLGGIYDDTVYNSCEMPPGFSSPFFATQTTERLLSNTLSKTTSPSYLSLASIQSAASEDQKVDLLLTNVWPASIARFSSVPLPNNIQIECRPLDTIIKRLQPRYHFAALGGHPPMFWEREPYVWQEDGQRVSRFISLGSFGGGVEGKKQRWFYAFSITPNDTPGQTPLNATDNPFLRTEAGVSKRVNETGGVDNYIFGDVRQTKRIKVEKSLSGEPPAGYQCHRCHKSDHYVELCPERSNLPEGYVCRICNIPGHLVRDCPTKHAVGDTGGKKPKSGYVCRACGSEKHFLEDCLSANARPSAGDRRYRGREPPKEISSDECWFCLSNPNLAKHLIVSIGSECYLTLPKGQIPPTQADGETDIPGGGHVLIVPITHYPTYNAIPSDLAKPTFDETEKYKSALRTLYAKYNTAGVFFELGRLNVKGGHAHVQSVPIPNSLQSEVRNAFIKEGQRQGIQFEEDVDAAMAQVHTGGGGESGYFRVDLPDGGQMIHLMKAGTPFSVQFGRQTLVKLLGYPDRFDWKACVLSDEEENADAQAFKTAFAAFDPNVVN